MNIIFSYNKLWKLLIDKGMKRTALMQLVGFSPSTLARLSKNQPTRMDVLAKICLVLDCGLDDVVEFSEDTVCDDNQISSPQR